MQNEETAEITKILAVGLVKSVGWTIVYYIGTMATLVGLGWIASKYIDRKEASAKK